MALKVNIQEILEAADKSSAASNSINGIDITDKPINATTESIIGSSFGAIGNVWSDSEEEYLKDIDRNQVIRNRYNTEEELAKQRAKNQSWLEQTANSLGQIVGREVVLGSLKGLTNIYDVANNIVREISADVRGEEYVNDFTSQASIIFEEAQDKLKERLAIHRENPTKAFDVLDFGWWADNFITVGSTLSLLIPTLATTKGLSALGRTAKSIVVGRNAANANKARRLIDGASGVSRSLAKGAYGLGLTTRPATLANKIDMGLSISANAFLQRTLENHQEAREVYKSTYEDALDRLNNMSEEDKAKMIERNQDVFGNMKSGTNEELASIIAEQSSYKTFRGDYWMLLMDMIQFAGIKGMYRGIADRNATANLRILNENAKRNLGKSAGSLTKGVEELTDAGKAVLRGQNEGLIKNNVWNRVKEAAKSPFNAFYQLQVTEGVEEGFQHIQAEKGAEIAKMVFDPETTQRSINSYLQDPITWEQAFWGMIGGLTFNVGGKAFAAAERKIKGQLNKDSLSEEDFARTQLTDEKLREIEILGRQDKLNAYIDKINKINQGINPYVSEKQQKPFEEGEADLLKQKATNDFITNLALDAADNGNFDLLIDFVNSPEFNKYLEENGVSDQLSSKFNAEVAETMKNIVEDYRNNLYTALEYAHEDNPFIANIIARHITRQKLTLDDIRNQISEIESNNDVNLNNYQTKSDIYYLEDYLNKLARLKISLDAQYDTKEISKAAYEQYMSDLMNELEAVADNGSIILDKTQYADLSSLMTHVKSKIKDFKDLNETIFDENINPTPDKTITDAANEVSALNATYRKYETNMPKTDEQWHKIYEEFEQAVTKVGQEKLMNANKRLRDYIAKSENPKAAYQQLLNGENVYEGVQEDLDLIKIGYRDTYLYWAMLEALANGEITRREEVAKQESTPTDNGQPTGNQSSVVAEESVPDAEIQGEEQGSNQQQTPQPNPQQRPVVDPEALIGSDEVRLTPEQQAEIDAQVQTEEPQPQITQQQENDLEQQYGTSVRANQISRLVAKLAKLIKQLRNSIPEINEGLKSTNVNSEEFQKLYEEVKYLLEQEGEELEDSSIEKKIIYKAIESALKDYIRIATNRGKSTASYEQLLTSLNNGSLLSRISLALEDSKDVQDEVLFNELKEFVKQKYNLTQVRKNTKRAVSLIEFFNYLINKENATIDEILVYYRFINEYIDSGVNGITFVDVAKFKEGFNDFIQELEQNNEVKSEIEESSFAISEIIEGLDNEAHDDLIFKIATGQIKAKIYIEQSQDTVSKLGYKPGVEFINPKYPTVLSVYYIDENNQKIRLGYIPKTRILGPNNTSIVNMGGTGFLFEFNGDNCNFDELIDAIEESIIDEEGEYYELYEEVLKYARNPSSYKFTGSASKILNIPIIKKLIQSGNGSNTVDIINDKLLDESLTFFAKNRGGIAFEYYAEDNESEVIESDEQKVETIISNLYKLIRGPKGEIDPTNIYTSYINYRTAMRNNMLNNLKMQEALANGKTIAADVFNLSSDIKLNNSQETRGIKEAIEGENIVDFPIIYDIGTYNGITDDGRRVALPIWHKSKRLSMLVYEKGNHPLIAPLDRNGLLESGSTIIEDVRKELKSIIEDFLTQDKLSYEEATKKLIELLQGNEFTKLFSGIRVKTFNGITYIQSRLASQPTLPDGSKNPYYGTYFLALNKYAKEDQKKTRTERDHYILTHTDPTKHAVGRRNYKNDDAIITHAVESIIANMQFNLSTFAADTTNPNAKSSRYFYKENDKIVVEIGGNKRVYNSYSEFVHKENTARTTVYKGDNGKLYTVVPGAAMGLGNIRYINVDKMFDTSGKEIRTLDQLYEDLLKKDKTKINVRTLLEIAGVEEDIADILFGKNTGINLIPTEVVYDSKEKDNDNFGAYNPSTGEISLGNRVFDRRRVNRKYELIRTLIHEHFHKLFNENADKEFIKVRTAELISTLNAFKQAILSDKNKNTQLKEAFKRFIEDITIQNGKLYENGKQLTKEQTLEVLEEWLVESLTQPLLSNHLNNTKYENADISAIKEENKSIFQKIVDAIIKLFNNIFGRKYKVGEIKNNTIFAKQYLILSDKLTNPQNNEEITKPTRERRGKKNNEEQGTLFDKQGNPNIQETKDEIKDEQEKVTNNAPSELNNNSPVEGEQSELDLSILGDQSIEEALGIDEFIPENDDNETNTFYSTIGLDLFSGATEEERAVTNMELDNAHNPNGIIKIENMNDFLDNFNAEDKLKIANLMAQGSLKYHCE